MSASWSSRKGSKVKSQIAVIQVGGRKGGNYMPKILEMQALLGPGFHMIDAAHDDWCASYKGKPCNCDPDITVTHSEPQERGS